MIEAFVGKSGAVYPFKHITYTYPGNNDTSLRLKTISSNDIVTILVISPEDKNQQLHNFMQYLTKPEPTTTKLS